MTTNDKWQSLPAVTRRCRQLHTRYVYSSELLQLAGSISTPDEQQHGARHEAPSPNCPPGPATLCYFSHMTLIFNQICLQKFPSNQSAKGFSWVMFFLRVWSGQNQSGESRAWSPALSPKLLGHYRRQRPTRKRPRLLQQEPRPWANRQQAGIWAFTSWQGEALGARTPKLQMSVRNTTTFSKTTGGTAWDFTRANPHIHQSWL